MLLSCIRIFFYEVNVDEELLVWMSLGWSYDVIVISDIVEVVDLVVD